ncbi:flocculation protein FLO11 [Stegastes partitus]|uniref:Flocculation protein FLO11 n=1 Tax=Stegastes partitus TaxID=144197 RepID=A0A9Y4KBM3_9TELE|nr:PREDICTED: TERF1-interacting nuclear factor 2 [Stegastes partitus]
MSVVSGDQELLPPQTDAGPRTELLVRARQRMDSQGACSRPDVDSQPLSLEDSWRLRVASARVYAIVRSRDVQRFEAAMGFLDAIYRLLPGLVAAIKHMKILFGLKTLVVMWMLKQRRAMVDTVSKVVQFFPSKLPQYRDRCTQREMFLMRKNHSDFKSLAQTLAMDQNRLEDYIQNQVEEEYGERYAQKVEDRLLLYLQQLEAVLPGDARIDKILKNQSPATEEKLLLQATTSDCSTIAAALNQLLGCDVASCRPAAQSSDVGQKGLEPSESPESAPCGSSSKARLESGGGRTNGPEVGSEDGALLLEDDAGGRPGTDGEVVEETESRKNISGGVQEALSSPQFCSRHQRWVKSILRECPDESSAELQLQANISSSPLLFLSSSSNSSSPDLTPSDLVPCPPGLLSQTPADLKENPSSGSTVSGAEPRPSSSRNLLLSPVVRLVDVASFRGRCAAFRPHPTFPDCFIICKQAASASSPQIPAPAASPASEDVPTPPNCQPTAHSVSRLSPTCREATTRSLTRKPVASASSPQIVLVAAQDGTCSTDYEPTRPTSSRLKTTAALRGNPLVQMTCPASSSPPPPDWSLSSFRSANTSSATSSRPLVPQTSQLETLPLCSANRQPRLSLPSQAVLLRSKLLQPSVGLTRLSGTECNRATNGRASIGRKESTEEGSGGDERTQDADSLFDVNHLFSSSGSEDSPDSDPDYRPPIKKTRLLLEYENAESL